MINPPFQISNKIQKLKDAKWGNLVILLLLEWSKPLAMLVRNSFPCFFLSLVKQTSTKSITNMAYHFMNLEGVTKAGVLHRDIHSWT